MAFKVKVELGHYEIKIRINGLNHVVIDRRLFVGYHSFYENGTRLVIEYHYKGGIILTEFDTFLKWSAVLKALDKNL